MLKDFFNLKQKPLFVSHDPAGVNLLSRLHCLDTPPPFVKKGEGVGVNFNDLARRKGGEGGGGGGI